MKINKEKLRQIISEEVASLLGEKKDKVSKKISYLMDKEGEKHDRAVAIALSMKDRGELEEAEHEDEKGDDADDEDALVLRDPPDIKRMKQGLKRISRPRSPGDFRSNKERFRKP